MKRLYSRTVIREHRSLVGPGAANNGVLYPAKTITVVQGDIFEQDVDAIVNPANSEMAHAGGLAGEIRRRGGRRVETESAKQAPVPTGGAIITSPGMMIELKAVIHAVGPIWGVRSQRQSDEFLSAAHLSAIQKADQHGITSLAFPAVSCGVFRFPVDRAAPIAVGAARAGLEASRNVRRLVFVLPEAEHYRLFRRALAPWYRRWF